MNTKGPVLVIALVMATFLCAVPSASAQFNNNPTLKIGDPAPALKVQGWVRGEPLTEFKKGKVYVVDFWATWCGGCIASFRHISDVADKYNGKVQFVSIDSYEDIDSKSPGFGKDPMIVVTDFLKTPPGQKLKLNVAVDGNAKGMYDAWIKTLRRNGFPTTFVIDQEGKIAWIDVNLDHLDWVLGQVLAKKWDRQKAADVMAGKDAAEDMMFGILRSKSTDKTSEYRAMLAATEAFEKRFPDRTDAVAFYKFMALLEIDPGKVASILEQMAADPLSRTINLSDAAGLTLRKQNLPRPAYGAVAKIEERILPYEYPEMNYGGRTVNNYRALGDAYEKSGEAQKAVDSIEKAIAVAQQQNAKADQIAKLQEILAKYRGEVASNKAGTR